MASLYKQPGSGKWWIRYTKDGKQIRKSTSTTDEDKALLQLREIELLLGQRNITGTVSQKLARAIQSETIQPVALAAVFENRRKHVAKKTQALYRSRDGRFLDWMNRICPDVSMISEVDRSMVKAFLDEVADEATPRTHNGYLRRLRTVFSSAVRDGFAVEDPTAGIDFLHANDSSRRPFTEDELERLFETLTGELRLLTMVGLHAAAMRLHDIVSLTWSNIDLNKGVIRWRMSKRRGKWMEIAIHPRLKKELTKVKIRRPKTPVFPAFYNNVNKTSEAFRQGLVKAGLKKDNRPEINRRYEQKKRERAKAEQEGRDYISKPAKRRKDELDFHSLRYNFVSILKSQGCPEAIARSIMGHSSAEVSAIYTHIDDASERKWVTSLPDVVGKK